MTPSQPHGSDSRCPCCGASRDDQRPECVMQRNTWLAHLIDDVATSGISFQDERMGYLEVQIDRPTWAEIREVAAALRNRP